MELSQFFDTRNKTTAVCIQGRCRLIVGFSFANLIISSESKLCCLFKIFFVVVNQSLQANVSRRTPFEVSFSSDQISYLLCDVIYSNLFHLGNHH